MSDCVEEIEAELWCLTCKSSPAVLWRVQVSPGSGVWRNVVKWVNGVKPQIKLACPRCEGDLVRGK